MAHNTLHFSHEGVQAASLHESIGPILPGYGRYVSITVVHNNARFCWTFRYIDTEVFNNKIATTTVDVDETESLLVSNIPMLKKLIFIGASPIYHCHMCKG